jgi:hypothetical protein
VRCAGPQEVMRAKKVAHVSQRPPFYARAGCCAHRRPQRPRFYARAGCCARRRPQRPLYYAVFTKFSKARPGCACTREVMRAKKVAHGSQRPPFYARIRAGCCARNYAVFTKSAKARPGYACTQEVMRAKKVAHGSQRPPFYARASYCAHRRPQRLRYYARVGGWWPRSHACRH